VKVLPRHRELPTKLIITLLIVNFYSCKTRWGFEWVSFMSRDTSFLLEDMQQKAPSWLKINELQSSKEMIAFHPRIDIKKNGWHFTLERGVQDTSCRLLYWPSKMRVGSFEGLKKLLFSLSKKWKKMHSCWQDTDSQVLYFAVSQTCLGCTSGAIKVEAVKKVWVSVYCH